MTPDDPQSPDGEPPIASPIDQSPPVERRADGRILPGSKLRLQHGARSALSRPGTSHLATPEEVAAIAEKRAAIVEHLGGEVAVIQEDLVFDYCRLDVLIDTVSENIWLAGVFTPEGDKRVPVDLLLALMGQRLRLAQTLGIERKAKPVVDLALAIKQAQDVRDKK